LLIQQLARRPQRHRAGHFHAHGLHDPGHARRSVRHRRCRFRRQEPSSERWRSDSALHQDALKAAETRQANEAEIREALSSETAREELKSAHIDYRQVDKAVGQLSDDDLARLAERSRQVNSDFAGGHVSDRDLLFIIVIALAIIIIIVALR
jgi:Flp pilus assembly protein TadB